MLNKIHHAAIICSDYSKAKDFYCRILGFPVIKETYRQERDSYKLDLQVGANDQIELFSFPQSPARITRPEACGLRHLAFQVADVHIVRKHLEDNGVACEPVRVDEITGKEFFFFFDPDGLPLEVYEQ
ncbi:MAG: VOC family protein [Candidatus Obscuribacterales bacterium]|nr:VOC family protein [Candidatus Obscuribacterales bacterium]